MVALFKCTCLACERLLSGPGQNYEYNRSQLHGLVALAGFEWGFWFMLRAAKLRLLLLAVKALSCPWGQSETSWSTQECSVSPVQHLYLPETRQSHHKSASQISCSLGSAGEVDLYLGNQGKLMVLCLYYWMLCEMHFFLTLWLRRWHHLLGVRHGLCRRESDFFTCWMWHCCGDYYYSHMWALKSLLFCESVQTNEMKSVLLMLCFSSNPWMLWCCRHQITALQPVASH